MTYAASSTIARAKAAFTWYVPGTVDVYLPGTKLHVPWEYKVVDHWRLVREPPGAYRLVEFSRAAFDRSHKSALFAVSDSCGGECGADGAVYAKKINGSWIFGDSGCRWIY